MLANIKRSPRARLPFPSFRQTVFLWLCFHFESESLDSNQNLAHRCSARWATFQIGAKGLEPLTSACTLSALSNWATLRKCAPYKLPVRTLGSVSAETLPAHYPLPTDYRNHGVVLSPRIKFSAVALARICKPPFGRIHFYTQYLRSLSCIYFSPHPILWYSSIILRFLPSKRKSLSIPFHKCGILRDFMPLSQTGVGNLTPSDL